jgi:hypothetical protein
MNMTPTLFTACNALPPEGAGLAWGGPALAAVALRFSLHVMRFAQ